MTTEAVIRRGEAYSKSEFMKRVGGWTETAWKTAKRRGLITVETAGRAYVTGDAFLDYIEGLVPSESADTPCSVDAD